MVHIYFEDDDFDDQFTLPDLDVAFHTPGQVAKVARRCVTAACEALGLEYLVNGQRSNTLCHVCVIVLNTPHASSPEQEELDGGRDRSTAVGPRSKNYTHTHIPMSVSVSILSQYPTCFYTTSHHCIPV